MPCKKHKGPRGGIQPQTHTPQQDILEIERGEYVRKDHSGKIVEEIDH